MFNEERLNACYNAIADDLEKMIPCEWEKVVIYAENKGGSTRWFYTPDGKMHEWDQVWTRYYVDWHVNRDNISKLGDSIREVWLECENSGETQWNIFVLEVDNKRNFKAKFSSALDETVDREVRELLFLYNECGIEPPKRCHEKRKVRKYLKSKGKEIPECFFEPQKTHILIDGQLKYTNILENVKEEIENYNKAFERAEKIEIDFEGAASKLSSWSSGRDIPEFAQSLVILLLTYVKRTYTRMVWIDAAEIAWNRGDMEICREIVKYASKQGAGVKGSNKEYVVLGRESKNENVADILGMIIEELRESNSLNEKKCKELLKDFGEPLDRWRNLEVQKAYQDESFDLLYQILELCMKHKAYHTAYRLVVLLFIADRAKKKSQLPKAMMIAGKLSYELGYMAVAKSCFECADQESKGKCWKDEDEKYHAVLQMETKLEITDEVRQVQKRMDEWVESGEFSTYSYDDIYASFDGEIEIPKIEPKKLKKTRMKVGEKAIQVYEKYAQGSREDKLKGIERAFKAFKEAPEVYEAAAYLYYIKANIAISEKNYELAYEELKKAYNCENGKRNGLVLLCFAIILSHMGRREEAKTFIYRAYILCGKKFVVDSLGFDAWQSIQNNVYSAIRINEDVLNSYYSAIGYKIKDIISEGWDKIYFYGEDIKGKSEVAVYFIMEDGKHYNIDDIVEKLGVSKGKAEERLAELKEIFELLWEQFYNNNEFIWTNLVFELNSKLQYYKWYGEETDFKKSFYKKTTSERAKECINIWRGLEICTE